MPGWGLNKYDVVAVALFFGGGTLGYLCLKKAIQLSKEL